MCNKQKQTNNAEHRYQIRVAVARCTIPCLKEKLSIELSYDACLNERIESKINISDTHETFGSGWHIKIACHGMAICGGSFPGVICNVCMISIIAS